MRDDLQLIERINEFFGVVALVSAQRYFRLRGYGLSGITNHLLGCFALDIPVGARDHCVGNQPVAVVRQRMADVAQLAGRLALVVQARIRIGRRGVRVVAARVAMEVRAITARAVARLEAPVSRPGLNERAVNTEVFSREPPTLIGHCDDLVKERHHHIVLDEPRAVLAEHRGYPHRIVHRQADEPAVQQVVVHLLHQLSLRADAVEHLQQHRAHEFLRGDARASTLDAGLVHARKQPVQARQCLVDHLAHRAQRVVGRNEILQPPDAEQLLGVAVGAVHALVPVGVWGACAVYRGGRGYFSSLLRHASRQK